ncbi:hypothetical protein IQ289_25385 [Burkholderia sp. R-70006]|uniref:hypothetical protein n=1 Tax=Paraburkholderia domus TaxID=2793075 RepID=UPI0019123A1F|nr:hypothetical protein [Paraburkholderia domus]MBK5051718.1 hypothetical protein [Burkholderia sp. R-70006]
MQAAFTDTVDGIEKIIGNRSIYGEKPLMERHLPTLLGLRYAHGNAARASAPETIFREEPST